MRNRTIFALVAGAFIVLLLINMFVPTLFSGAVLAAGRPLWFIEDRIGQGFSFLTSGLRSKAALQSENMALKQENAFLKNEVADRDLITEQNNMLRIALGRMDKPGQLIFANVLTEPAFAGYDTLIIDAGSKQGIKTGNKVQLSNGTIIGSVERIQTGSARVILLSNPGSENPVIIGNASSTITATATGLGTGNFQIKLPKGVTVSLGEPIRLAGTGTTVLSTIEKIENDPADSFQQIYFKLPIPPNDISSVFIDPTNHD